MSADNWDHCPRCADTDVDEVAALQTHLNNSYGKLSFEEYETLRVQIETAKYEKTQKGAPAYATFREDYEFYGADTGTLTISYRGHCTKCNLSLKIQEEREFYKGGN